MSAKITNIIPLQKCELIRDRIGAILAVELTNQHTLDSGFAVPEIFTERFVPFNADTQFPCINICLWKGDFDSANQRNVNGNYTFIIDTYTNSGSTSSEEGDTLAIVQLTRLLGMIRAILKNPAYTTLGFAAGWIGNTAVTNILIEKKGQLPDSLNDIIGRMIFTVRALESYELIDSNLIANEITTTIELYGTAGYFQDLVSLIKTQDGNNYVTQNNDYLISNILQ